MTGRTPEPLIDPATLPEPLRDGHVVVGNFDGVHRGHAAVIAQAAEPAHAAGRPVVALTFEPHPRTFFQPDRPLFRLTDSREKARLLARAGADATVVLTFDERLSQIEAEDFVAEVLARRLGAHTVVVGWDFHFGRGRLGSPAFLAEAGPRHGMFVEVVPPHGGATPVSSSAIRDLLAAGDLAAANRLLGRRWTVETEVVHGDKRGRELGFPTANLVLPPETRLAYGIYAVRALVDGAIVNGVASFGSRPQFDDGAPRLEVFLLDFSGDLYGKRLRVELVAWQRAEAKFESVEALIAQMERDKAEARRLLTQPEDPLAPSALV
ncbi:riboflavin kinase/FMN adenylyltransferase [Methylopila capsulata]|uniref:Riboflavin biosynthesis protein n=1 Tax=Methylopila capsulata TaxID=61654 RepID=A0A9W6MSW3_9HYPH|nr:bifunctional riboflavin kinase/FAD synthetase [Methylopila capsulata]MBM7852550.1 riboflavin kinase/FMN adenylyltransferase [Methylopila capsulata]GLK56758.1 riboflavin biosynthesis protein RibF [Methylopila capsulata]